MRRPSRLILLVVAAGASLALALAGVFASFRPGGARAVSSSSGSTDLEKRARARNMLGKLPLYFIENRGQEDPRVAFSVPGRDTTVYFTPGGVTFALTRPEPRGSGALARLASKESRNTGRDRWAVKLEFLGANPTVIPRGQEQSPAVWSYFNGPSSQWKAGLKTYNSLIYADLWPGIDLVYSGRSGQLKYTFLVKPGADPSRIRLAYRGVTAARVNEKEQLEVSTPVGGFSDDVPFAYQEIAGGRVNVSMHYAPAPDSEAGAFAYGFRIGGYDKSLPLVMDPSFAVYSGFIGGSSEEFGEAIALDAAGNAYVVGTTRSTAGSFPETVGPDLTHNGGRDAFVAKVKADGTGLVYAGYIGGSEGDDGHAVAVDSAGNAYVVGSTASSSGAPIPFPALVGPRLSFSGITAFVAKVKADGTALVYSGFIGGGSDGAHGVAVDSAGAAYVVGDTATANFPVTVGPDLTFNGEVDAFVAKVRPDGTDFVFAGLIGGAEGDFARGVAVDSAHNVYVVGTTNSNELSFPVRVGPDLSFNGPTDAFVAKVRSDGTGLVYGGYIGGAFGNAVAVDSAGNAYVTGETGEGAPFPFTVGPDLTLNGEDDAFVAKVKADGTQLLYAGVIGGSDTDRGNGIAVDAAGSAYVVGETDSPGGFLVRGGPDLSYNGGASDAFLAKIRPDGTGFLYAGYFGGSSDDIGNGVAVDSAGNAYIVGTTPSDEPSFPVTVGPDLTFNGFADAFVAKISGKPDLLDGGVQTPTAAKPGTSFVVTSTAVNNALGTAPSSRTRYYLSTDEEKSDNDILLGGSKTAPSLAPVTVSSGNATVTSPANTPLGAYFVLACADDLSAVSELNENNNCGPSNGTMLITLPDLRVTAQSGPPASANPGNRITVSDAVKNFGAIAAASSTTRYYLSFDSLKSANDVRLTGSRAVPALAPQADSGFSVSVTIPSNTAPGVYHILACADDLGTVAETDDNNNCRATSSTMNLTSPAFDPAVGLKPSGRVATVTVLATCTDGAEVRLTVSVSQGGAFGEGTATGVCTGNAERYPVTVPAEGPASFTAGPAEVHGEAVVKDHGHVLDDHQWTRTLNLVFTPGGSR